MKKLVVIAPVLPQPTDLESIANSLSFLSEDYHIDFIDPLTTITNNYSNEIYYQQWNAKLAEYIPTHDAFFGFSFGGIILQQCFPLLNRAKKSIVLFSTPTKTDESLLNKLGAVIQLCKKNCLQQALFYLYEHVFYPNESPKSFDIANEPLAKNRLISGLQRVLATDSTAILCETKVEHLHLVGESSRLVNANNVLLPKTGRVVFVPRAGMRVLQDQADFCKKIILETLNDDY